MKENDISEIIQNLKTHIRSKELILFCGSGISCDSGLPTAYGLTDKLLEVIMNKNMHLVQIVSQADIPFEYFIESVSKLIPIEIILSTFQHGQPNFIHYVLSALMNEKNVRIITTTNFDLCFEKALDDSGTTYKKIVHEKKFSKFSHKHNTLIKIHGCINQPESIRSTLESVVDKSKINKRFPAIKRIFGAGCDSLVLVLGYSCSDKFDITELVQRIPKKDRSGIAYVSHIRTEETKEWKMAKLTGDVDDLKIETKENDFLKDYSGYYITANTNKFLKELIKELGLANVPDPKKIWWNENIDEFEKAISIRKGIREVIAGVLLTMSVQFPLAVEQFHKALEIAIQEKDQELIFSCLLNRGIAYLSQGQYPNVFSDMQTAFPLSRKIKNRSGESKIHEILGAIYMRSANAKKAVYHHKKALSIEKRLGRKSRIADCYNNIGASTTDYRYAVKVLKKAQVLYESTANLRGEMLCKINFGNAYCNMEEFEISKKYYKEALDISIYLGDIEHEARIRYTQGNLCFESKRYETAKSNYNQALDISRKMDFMQLQSHSLVGIGDVERHGYQRYEEALDCYKEAAIICNSLGDIFSEAYCYQNAGRAAKRIVGHDAGQYFDKAKRLYEEIGDIEGAEECMYGL